jgi:Icc-related predicted phosphoesterase
MRAVFISDMHEYHKSVEIPQCDLLVCSGDLTYKGDVKVYESFSNWCKDLKDKGTVREVITTLGNHDLSGDRKFTRYYVDNFRDYFKDCHLLMDEAFEFEGLKIFGSPKTPEFGNWGFMYDSALEAEFTWSLIPEDTNLLITHGPPRGILDLTDGGDKAGCLELYKRVMELPDLVTHSFGHIHESYGHMKKGNKLFINASTCNLRYNPVNPPIVVDFENVNGKWVTKVINPS